MLLDKGKAQTKYKKNDITGRITDGIEGKAAPIWGFSYHSIVTQPIKDKRLAVVNKVIFSSFEVRKSAA